MPGDENRRCAGAIPNKTLQRATPAIHSWCMHMERCMHMSSNGALASLGIIGAKPIEPVVLAALITAEPLLLIGPHGTGKSFLLNRVADALGLASRHYNASLLNFDDLVGYPLPNAAGGLDYVRTPCAIWGAQVVFFDEISRCRADMQNKLFPIVHERRVQGIELTELIYRWAAMNPPRTEDDDSGIYSGSEPLDIALADRFAFVVEMPAWGSFGAEDQEAVIRADAAPVVPENRAHFAATLERGRSLWVAIRSGLHEQLAPYVRILVVLLARAGIELSPRRAGMLLRNIAAVHAATLACKDLAKLQDSALAAVLNSLPQRAWGAAVNEVKLLAAHRAAWKAAQVDESNVVQRLLLEPDPLRRVAIATEADTLSPQEFSTVVADVIATLGIGARHALAFELFESGAAGRLVAAIADQCACMAAFAANPQDVHDAVSSASTQHKNWQHIVMLLARLEAGTEETALATNLLCGLYSKNQFPSTVDVDEALAGWQATRQAFRLPRQSAKRRSA